MSTVVALVLGVGFVLMPLADRAAAGEARAIQDSVTSSARWKENVEREERLTTLRARARARIDKDRTRFSDAERADIEARYRSAHENFPLEFLRLPAGRAILADLIATYPSSNRAGCAVLELARISHGEERERYLKQAIANHSDSWFESGVQVGPMARALLATYYAGLDRYDEAERLAEDLARRYPGAVDESGWPLDAVLTGVKLLRPRR